MNNSATQKKQKRNTLFYYILAALITGIIAGQLVHSYTSAETIAMVSSNIKLLGTIFIKLVQMIIAPLVFCTITVGICKMGDAKMVGRVGGKAMLWFMSATVVSCS